jgi:predicted ribosomally synthesized peptide with SipW-like signal peptide
MRTKTMQLTAKTMKARFTIIALLLVLLLAALVIGGTMAYLQDKAETENTFTVGNLGLALNEPDYPNPQNLSPGDCFPKNPTVTSLWGNGYMRATVEIVDLQTGRRITDPARLALIWSTIFYTEDYDAALPGSQALPLDRDGKNVPGSLQKTQAQLEALRQSDKAADYNMTEFQKDAARSAPGYTCFNYIGGDGIFREGDKAVLFNSIAFPSDWNAVTMEQLGQYQVVLRAEAIQADYMADAAQAFAMLDKELAQPGS